MAQNEYKKNFDALNSTLENQNAILLKLLQEIQKNKDNKKDASTKTHRNRRTKEKIAEDKARAQIQIDKEEEEKIKLEKDKISLDEAKKRHKEFEDRFQERERDRRATAYKRTASYKLAQGIKNEKGGSGLSTAISMASGGMINPVIAKTLGLDKMLSHGLHGLENLAINTFGSKNKKRDNSALETKTEDKILNKLDTIANNTRKKEDKNKDTKEKEEFSFLKLLKVGALGLLIAFTKLGLAIPGIRHAMGLLAIGFNVLKTISDGLVAAFNFLSPIVSNACEKLYSFGKYIGEKITNAFVDLMPKLKNFGTSLKNGIESVKEFGKSLKDSIKDFFKKGIDKGKAVTKKTIELGKKVFDKSKDIAKNVADKTLGFGKKLFNKGKEVTGNLFNKGGSKIPKTLGLGTKVAKGIPILAVADGTFEAYRVGQEIGNAGGINEYGKKVNDELRNKNALENLKGTFNIFEPEKMIPNLSELMYKGIVKALGENDKLQNDHSNLKLNNPYSIETKRELSEETQNAINFTKFQSMRNNIPSEELMQSIINTNNNTISTPIVNNTNINMMEQMQVYATGDIAGTLFSNRR